MALALPAGAGAGPPEYADDTESWNGLGYLRTTAEEARVTLDLVAELDLSELRPSDVVMWLYPTRDMPVEDLLGFVADGGRLIVADDHGRADELLEALGIRRKQLTSDSRRAAYRDLPHLPVIPATEDHFLFFNVDEVVANHPVVLEGEGSVVGRLAGSGEAVIVERRHGLGFVLALGDPSVFINDMVRRFHGNKQFAANVMRLYCLQDACRLRLVQSDAGSIGAYRQGLGHLGRLPVIFRDAAQMLNRHLAALNGWLGSPPWGQLLLMSLLMGGLFAWRASGRQVSHFARPPRLEQPASRDGSPVMLQRLGLVANQEDADFAEPCVVLLGEAARLERHPTAQTLRQRQAGEPSGTLQARAAVLRIAAVADSVQGPEPAIIGAERFLQLRLDVQTLSSFVDRQP